MFKVFVLVFEGAAWKVLETIEATSKADSKSSARSLRRKYHGRKPLVLVYPVGDVPAYIPC